jgi:predicted alpha/beta superfamily hydrolase
MVGDDMKLIKQDFFAEALNRDVVLYIGLPDGYNQSNKRYPVLYMQDGHNVFLKEDSFMGETWQMLELYKENQDLPQVIVVALNASQKDKGRFYEYSPYPFTIENEDFHGYGGGGDVYVDYLVHTIKPMIDQNYRTKPTESAIMGSSLGGFIALYACLKYPKVFKKVASLSGSYFVALDPMIQAIKKSNLDSIECIYLDTGDAEIAGGNSSDYMESNQKIYDTLLKQVGDKKVIYCIIEGGKHQELDWAKRLKPVMQLLFT